MGGGAQGASCQVLPGKSRDAHQHERGLLPCHAVPAGRTWRGIRVPPQSLRLFDCPLNAVHQDAPIADAAARWFENQWNAPRFAGWLRRSDNSSFNPIPNDCLAP